MLEVIVILLVISKSYQSDVALLLGSDSDSQFEIYTSHQNRKSTCLEGRTIVYPGKFTGDFLGTEPDRSECVAKWVKDLKDMVDNDGVASAQIANIMAENTKSPTGEDKGMTGGSINELVMLYDKVLKKHREEETDEDSSVEFTRNIMHATSILMISKTGWKEISNEKTRFTCVSQILSGIDTLGYIFGTKSDAWRKSCERQETFPTENIQLVVRNLPAGSNGGECFSLDTYGSVCLPPASDSSEGQEGCRVHVATAFRVPKGSRGMFLPHTQSGANLGDNLVGLTIENKDSQLNNNSSQPVVVTIRHDNVQNSASKRSCQWWSHHHHNFSDSGCTVSLDSTNTQTVCHCDHLTNFGVIFDYTGQADANNTMLNIVTNILLTLSTVSILTTQLMLYVLKSDPRSSTRRCAENNRNWSLLAAQCCWLVLVPQVQVSSPVCQLFGSITHFLYLAFFAWTALEGYFFYRALVTVFDTNRLSMLLHYLLGYLVPLVIVAITLTIGLATGESPYLRMEDNEVAACFLSPTYIPSLVAPAALVLVVNLGITATAVWVAHRAGARRGTSSRGRVMATLRNTLLLSLLLGLTWLIGLLPASLPVQWISIILNCSQGFYILLYSVLANRVIRGQVRERITEVASTYMPSWAEKANRKNDTVDNRTEDEAIASDFSGSSDTLQEEKLKEPLDMEHNQLENLKKDQSMLMS